MSQSQTNNDDNYKQYLKYLELYSKCMNPIILAAVERQGNIYDVKETVNLEEYCIFERKNVQNYRILLKQNLI